MRLNQAPQFQQVRSSMQAAPMRVLYQFCFRLIHATMPND